MDPISEMIWPYFVSLFVGIIIVAVIIDKKRREALESIAKDLGVEFSPSGRRLTLSELEHFELLQKGRQRKVKKELWGALNGNDFRIFVYSYREDSAYNRWRHTTVLSIKSSRLNAPRLSLQPKPKRLVMVPDFGQYDGFDISPALSLSYVIKGDDEVAIREFFKPTVLNYFTSNTGFYFEAQQDTLILYDSKQRSCYSDVKKLYAQGQELLSKLIN